MRESQHKVLFVLLDAFRHDYINPVDTPFLFSRTQVGFYARKLKSTSGFTQRTAIYTGTTGTTSGMFTMFTFDAQNSPFRFLRGDARLSKFADTTHWWDQLPPLPGMGRLKNMMNRRFEHDRQTFIHWIEQEKKRFADNAPLAHIPLELLPEIGISEDVRPIYLPNALEVETIFDVFSREQIKYQYLMYPLVNVQDDAVLEAFLKNRDSDAQIILGQFSDSDFLVHHCGPSSPKRRQIVGEIDRKLREIDMHYGDNTTWIVIGDHGMTDVVEELSIPEILAPLEKRHKVKMGKDYLLFLDSTMARFLWKTERGKYFGADVIHLPELLAKGRFIDTALAADYEIPFPDRHYGDVIWWANLGVLLFPDYFHDLQTHNKGMHGYDSTHDDMKGFFLAFGPGIEPAVVDQVNLVDVCPSICKAVGIPAPRHSKGKCLI